MVPPRFLVAHRMSQPLSQIEHHQEQLAEERCVKKHSIQPKIEPSKPVCCNFNKRHWCGTLSNVLQKYMITKSTWFLWSGAEVSSNSIIAELSRAKHASGARQRSTMDKKMK